MRLESPPARTRSDRRLSPGRIRPIWTASSAAATVAHAAAAAGRPPAITAATTAAAKAASTRFRARKTSRPMPSPMGIVTPGARNFSGASRNEIARTIPSHTKVTATAAAPLVPMSGRRSGGGPGGHVPGEIRR
ncbi:MAG TPA: hypothetical protein VFV73_09390 [Streptosporangiaceae bacterium]|nr:hypothetical protein [Streptosporangiaceae bacterium]